MIPIIASDQALRPAIFRWRGSIQQARLEEWLRSRHLEVPADLRELWQETGGGELFESETILSPIGSVEFGDDVDSLNKLHRDRGLSHGYLIVHDGCALTAIRLADKKWVVLDRSTYSERKTYDNLEDWYRLVLRAEYAKRYGLPRE